MKLQELAEVCLSGRRAAARVGCNYRLDRIRLTNMGLSYEDISRVERAVNEIESYTDRVLASLETPAPQ